jgi:hypothetical protein
LIALRFKGDTTTRFKKIKNKKQWKQKEQITKKKKNREKRKKQKEKKKNAKTLPAWLKNCNKLCFAILPFVPSSFPSFFSSPSSPYRRSVVR